MHHDAHTRPSRLPHGYKLLVGTWRGQIMPLALSSQERTQAPAYSSIPAGRRHIACLWHQLASLRQQTRYLVPHVSCVLTTAAAGTDTSLVLAGRLTYRQMGRRRQGLLPINRLRGTRGAAHSLLCTSSTPKLPRMWWNKLVCRPCVHDQVRIAAQRAQISDGEDASLSYRQVVLESVSFRG